ncbi:HupE/UreJ family protein [Rhodoferax sp. WC2427]|uniref:HupE/UreJ family protein n=1 Tax=Rhodoferax sp. WC2427 TaxID=3234144 RepID=UPI0034669A3D
MKRLLSILCALCLSAPAWAHKGSDAYLDVRQQGSALTLQLAVALKDLDLLIPVDANADGQVTWAEVQAATPAALALLQSHTGLVGAGPGCTLHWTFDGLEARSDGAYLRATSPAACPPGTALDLRYTLFKAEDSNHRLIVTGHLDGHDLLATAAPQQALPLALRQAVAAPPRAIHGIAATLWDYLQLGMHHLLQGYDHMAFLLALVLPLQLRLGRAAGQGAPVAGRSPWWSLLRTVTAFTVGHSITLALATFGWTEASPRWVEPAIAASIAFTALLNIYPVRVLRPERLALVFGLVHGYGFAGLLIEAAAPAGLLPWALAGFNLGVEAGQLTAVAAWVLLSQVVVRQPWYASAVVRGGSWLLVALAAYWFWLRVV